METATLENASLTRYEAYQDSRVEWLGEIPAHWELTKLGTKFFERKEKVSDKDYAPLSVTKQGILPQLDSAAKTNDGDNRKLVKSGDFVINSRSDRKGSSGVSSLDGSVSLINIVLEPQGLSSDFCHYLLKSHNFIEEFYRQGHGIVADLWTTRYSEMKAITIAVPEKEEQNRIANFLDQKTAQIDQAIAQKERLIALLQERRQVMIHRAVTQGLNPDVPMKNSETNWVGEIPAHWKVKRLKFISSVQSGVTLGKSYFGKKLPSYPYIRVANVQAGYFNLDSIAEINIPNREAAKYFVRVGDILVTEGGDLDKLGRGTVWKGEIQNCLHQNHIFAIRVNQSIVTSEYASLTLESDYGRKYFTTTANKTTNLASTNSTKLGNFPVVVPPLAEQADISEYTDTISKKIADAVFLKEKEIDNLRLYKMSLINSAVTGKIKV